MVNESDIFDLVKNSDLETKPAALATKVELKAETVKIMKLQTHNLSYFLDKIFFYNYGFENIFIYQPTLDTLE